MLYLDLETRSQEDLIKHGLARYAQHPTTDVICMAYAFDDDPIQFWWSDDAPFPQEVLNWMGEGGPIMAHNAEFEKYLFDFVISNIYNFDAPALTQWRCSMALSLASGFAGGLDTAAMQIGLASGKHKEGARLIRTYCAPGFLTEFLPGDAELMQEYCEGDVDLMRNLVKECREFTDTEICDQALGNANEVAEDADQ